MNVISASRGTAVMEMSKGELRICGNALNEVRNAIEIAPFEPRIGGSHQAAEALHRQIREACKTLAEDGDQIQMRFGQGELSMLANSIREVCRELEDWEFETRMDCSRESVQELLKEVSSAYEQVSAPE